MAGSGRGKCDKGKEKIKDNISEMKNVQIGTSYTSPNLQEKQSNISGPSQAYVDRSLSGLSSFVETWIENLLSARLEKIYKKALELLVHTGYSTDIALKAILNFGSVFGPMSILTNIVTNSIVYIHCGYLQKSCTCVENEPIFENLRELTRFSLQSLVDALIKLRPDWKKGDALRHILSNNIIAVPMEKNLSPAANSMVLGNKSGPSDKIHFKATSEGPVELQNVDRNFTSPAWGNQPAKAFDSLAVANKSFTVANKNGPPEEIHLKATSEGPVGLQNVDRNFTSLAWGNQLAKAFDSLAVANKSFTAASSTHPEVNPTSLATSELSKDAKSVCSALLDECMRKLQLENSEIRSQLAASRSGTEISIKILQLSLDRQKKKLADIADLEKQIGKVQEKPEKQKQKNLQLEQQLLSARTAQKEPEAVDVDFARAKKKHK